MAVLDKGFPVSGVCNRKTRTRAPIQTTLTGELDVEFQNTRGTSASVANCRILILET